MKRYRNSRSYLCGVVILSAFVAFEFNTNGQTNMYMRTPLLLRHTLVGKPCRGDKINFLVQLVNVSKAKVNIDSRFIMRYKSEFYFPESTSPKGRTALGDSFPARRVPDEYVITLLPGESFDKNYFIDSATDGFFREVGSYRIKVAYGQHRRYSQKGKRMFVGNVDALPLDFKVLECPSQKHFGTGGTVSDAAILYGSWKKAKHSVTAWNFEDGNE